MLSSNLSEWSSRSSRVKGFDRNVERGKREMTTMVAKAGGAQEAEKTGTVERGTETECAVLAVAGETTSRGDPEALIVEEADMEIAIKIGAETDAGIEAQIDETGVENPHTAGIRIVAGAAAALHRVMEGNAKVQVP